MHLPVLKREIIQYFQVEANQNFVDATIDGGGHAKALLKNNAPQGKVLGIEIDPAVADRLKSLKTEFGKRLIVVNDSFVNLKRIVEEQNFGVINGILFDLGLSSWHLKQGGRGFSFQINEPLDMRFGEQSLTALEIINLWPPEEIKKILKDFGEERFAAKISEAIVKQRKIKKITTTDELIEVIKQATPRWYHFQKIHPATRTFQALRIAVNDELENLKLVLPQALAILAPEGKIAVISFHSLEDRIVKNFFKEKQKSGEMKILTKKPVSPDNEEIKLNPASRSAKLRVALKIKNKCVN